MTSKQTSGDRASTSRTDQVRAAVDQAFQAAGAQLTRERAQEIADEIADELTSAAQRVREVLEDLRPAKEADVLGRIEDRLAALEERVAAIETAKRPAARKPAAKKPAKASSKKPGAPPATS